MHGRIQCHLVVDRHPLLLELHLELVEDRFVKLLFDLLAVLTVLLENLFEFRAEGGDIR